MRVTSSRVLIEIQSDHLNMVTDLNCFASPIKQNNNYISATSCSEINLPAPGNTATRALGITDLTISTTISKTLHNTCAWSYRSKNEIFYDQNFGGCLTPSNAEVAVTCTDNGGTVTSQLRFIQAITASFNLTVDCDTTTVSFLTLIIQACSSPTPTNVPVNPSSGVYNTQANFQCSHGSTLFYVNGTSGNTATKCLATAEWENEKIVQCWSAPTTTLIGNNTICAGNIATFQCTATGGVPSLNRVEIYFNNHNQTLVGNTWTSNPLNSSNNGNIVECRAINSYTAMQQYSNLGRDSKTLIIHYAATNLKFETKFTDLLINLSSGYLLRSDETLTMNCSADGNPAVTCTWSCSPTNCSSLPNTCEINNVNVINSTTITCTVGNGVCGGGTTSIDQKITVVNKTRVPNIVVDGSTTTATSIKRNKTENLTLTCEILNQKEMNTFFVWIKDGFVKSSSYSGNLTIKNLSPEDTGSYSCHTSDAFGNFSSSLYIDVYYPATNQKLETKFSDLLINSSSGYLLRSDEMLTMNCSADGNPAVNCTWSCSSSNCGSLPNTCEINNINVIDSTTITCTVGNGVCGGGTTSIDQKITVVNKTRAPNISVDGVPSTASSITRNKTESLSLACGIQNQIEMNTKIIWKKDGIIKSGTSFGTLTIDNLLPEDTGPYSCNTSDAFGNFSSSLYVDVYYAAEGFAVNDGTTSHSNICTWYIAPPGPRSCNITFSLNPTTHTTTLTKDGAMVTNDATNQPQTSTSQTFVFTRNQPSFNDSGNYTLKINNSIFENTFTFNISVINEVQPTTTTTPATGGTPPPIPPPDNLGVIIGAAVGGVVAFILIIILVVYCLRKQRNKKQDASSPADRGENGDNNFQGREEVDNPLYATSGLHTSAHGGSKDNSHVNPSFDAGSAEKEEVINPLYATSSSNGAKKKTKGGDTYSEVKKKSKNKSEKEEKVNPLYGSSGQPDNAEGAYAEVDKKGKKSKPTKEEKTNPLYVSSGPPDGIDGAYAEVDKKKKKGKKGKGEKEEKVNPLYVSSDQPRVEEAYAEVDKKKKGKKGKGEKEEKVNPLYVPSDQPDKVEDAYAEVDKKKNKKKSGKGEKEEKVNPLYVSSDQPDKVEDAYAEVDKKKSKKMKPPPALPPTASATYSEVKKIKKPPTPTAHNDNPYAEVTGELHGKTNNMEVARPLTSSKKVKPPVPVKPKPIKPSETAQLHSNC
ncbi:uncharacterized protein LOC100184005 [Ciona intestinalis]